jgi:hydrogenase nickel incorporation protein HypA/HybF
MHELSIALSIVDGALEELERRGLKRASAIYVRLGRLAGVDKDALQFSYNVASQETLLAASRLEIEEIDAAIFCPVCRGERLTRVVSSSEVCALRSARGTCGSRSRVGN